eukprot:497821_1
MITGTTTTGYDECWFEMAIHFDSSKQYPFPKELENRISHYTFNQIIRTIHDITDNLDFKKKEYNRWTKVTTICFLLPISFWFNELLQLIVNPSEFKLDITMIIVFSLCWLIYCCTGCKAIRIENVRKIIQGIELQSRLKIMNEITKDKMTLSYQNSKLIFHIKTDRVEIPNNLLYISDAANYDGFNPLLTDNINENDYVYAEAFKPIIAYEVEIDITSKRKYKFPKKFADRMHENTFSQITKTLNDIVENTGVELKKKIRKYVILFWLMLCVGIGIIVLEVVCLISAKGGTCKAVFCVGLWILLPVWTIGMLVVNIIVQKYESDRRTLCVNELNDRINIMNKRMNNQVTFTYFYEKLVIEVKVDYLQVKNDLLIIVASNDGLNEYGALNGMAGETDAFLNKIYI